MPYSPDHAYFSMLNSTNSVRKKHEAGTFYKIYANVF